MNNSFVGLFVYLSFSLLACPRPSSADQPKVKIGVISTLSGGMATIGTAVQRGINLARAERPELFQNIEFTFEDDQYSAKQSIAAYRSLRDVPRVRLIFGFGNVLAYAIGPLLEHDHIPMLNFNFEAAPVVGRRFIVRTMNHTDQYVAALAAHLLRSGQAEFPVVRSESSFFQTMVTGLTAHVRESAQVRELAVIPPGEMDFRSTILKLKPFARAHLGLFLFPDQLLAFMRQARESGFEAKIFGTDLCETAASLATAGDLMESCIFPDNEASADFRARYLKRYGDRAQLTFAGSAYDMTILVGEILRDNPTLESEKFLEALANVRARQGVLGEYSYKHTREFGDFFEYPIRVKQIKRGLGESVR